MMDSAGSERQFFLFRSLEPNGGVVLGVAIVVDRDFFTRLDISDAKEINGHALEIVFEVGIGRAIVVVNRAVAKCDGWPVSIGTPEEIVIVKRRVVDDFEFFRGQDDHRTYFDHITGFNGLCGEHSPAVKCT